MSPEDLAGWRLERTLRDGSRVAIEPITPAAKERLQAGLSMLSERTRWRRFSSALHSLSERELRYLTEVDQVDHLAIGALDLDHPELPGLGVARCVRLPEDPATGEFAVVIADKAQRLGLGTLLLGVLRHLARDRGFQWFLGLVQATNAPMLGLLEELQGRQERREGTSVWVRVPLELDPEADSRALRVWRHLDETFA